MAQEIIQQKQCAVCGLTKPITDFGKDPRYKYGVKSKCKICAVAYTREWRRAQNPVLPIEPIDGEEWRSLPGAGMSVSNFGRVRRDIKKFRKRAGRLHKLYKEQGYPMVYVLSRRKMEFVHRLVGELFLAPAPSRPYINHKNGDRADNRIGNLEWCTHAENMEHARRVLHKSGERKLDEQKVKELRELYKDHVQMLTPNDFRAIATSYGMERQAIQKALRGQTWKHVE